MAREEALQERPIDFAVGVMDLCDQLPKSFAGRHICEQLFRSATACAAKYAEARGAESRSDFIHKLGIVRKESCECLVWLRLITRRHLVPAETLDPIRDECDQLVKFVSASKITAERNARLGKPEK